MTKIKNYGLDSTINDDDKVIGTDGLPGPNFGKTKNYSIGSLVTYIENQLDPVDGSGTLNTIPIWTPDGDTLGDSILTYSPVNTEITVGGKLNVASTLNVVGNTTVASLTLQGYLADVNGEYGTAGQLLSSTGTAVDWQDFSTLVPNNITGSGTLNTIAMFTPDGTAIGNSVIVQDAAGTRIDINSTLAVNGNTGIVGDLDLSGVATFENDISVGEGLKDASDSYGTSNQILTSTGTQTSWQDFSALVPNNITGSGTVEYIPKFTPDGTAIGNSIMFTKANGIELQVGVSGATETILGAGFMSTGGVGADTVTATNINAGATGTLTASGNIILGDATADTTTINSTLSILSVVKDSNDTLGTDGQVLVANAASELLWQDQDGDTTYSISSQQAASDVEINLAGSDGTETEVTLVAGNSISLTDNGSNQITIAATGGAANTTYVLDHTQSAGSVSIELAGSDGSLTDYVLTAGTGVSFDNSVSGTTSIGIAADNVTGTGAATRVAFWDTASTLTSDADLYWWTANPEGRLGIGTSTPNTALHVAGTFRSNGTSYFSTDGPTSIAHLGGGTTTTSQFNITSTATGGSFISATNKLSLKANNTTAIHIDNTGKVGIGTTTPVSKLDVDGDYISMNGIPFVKQIAAANTIYLGDVDGNGQSVELSSDTDRLVKLSGGILELGNSGVNTQIAAVAPIWLKSSLQDGAQSPGTAGQILTSTGSQVQWVDISGLIPNNVTGSGTENFGVLWGAGGTVLTDSLLKHGTGVNSVGIGLNNDTQGLESIAFTRSTSKADYSFALGYESVTDGEFSVTLGKGTYTAGRHAMAANYKSLALGQSSFAGGHTSATGGDGAVALGHNASAGNFGAAKLVSTFPNDQTTFDIEGIVGTVEAGLFMRFGENLDVPDPRIEILTFTDNGNNSATLTVAAPGIRPIQGELVVFEEATPFRGDHQGGVALGNDAYSLGEGTISIGHTSVAEADKAVALGDAARSSGASSVAIGKNATVTSTDTIALGGNSTKILMNALAASSSYADDTAAAAGGVAIGELYRNGNIVQIRLT